jgi:cytochrome c553
MRAWVGLIVLACGCWGTDTRTALLEEQTRDGMGEHHAEVQAARDAVIAGDLQAGKKALEGLKKRLPLAAVSGSAQAPLELAVTATVGADDLDGFARGLGEVAAACGTCHRASGARPPGDAGSRPPIGGDLASQMVLHRWAMVRLWDGLVAADEGVMADASTALAAAPMVPSGTPLDSPVSPEATALEVRVHDLAARAVRAPDLRAKGRAVGEMLSTCHQCHLLTSGGPK